MKTCLHQEYGLCPSCQAEADYDPDAWAEYGYHADGERRWRELLEEIADDATTPDVVVGGVELDEIPF